LKNFLKNEEIFKNLTKLKKLEKTSGFERKLQKLLKLLFDKLDGKT
jgi:hypothetical protein